MPWTLMSNRQHVSTHLAFVLEGEAAIDLSLIYMDGCIILTPLPLYSTRAEG